MEGQRKVYDTFMLKHVWLDYIVMENDEIKKKIFLWSNVPQGGHRHATPPCEACWTAQSRLGKKFTKKKIFLLNK